MAKTRITIITPARQLFYIFFVAVALVCCGSWLMGIYEHVDVSSKGISDIELKAQFCSIQRRLDRGEDALQSMAVPEGRLFVHSFYGYALINVALDAPPDSDVRHQACAEVKNILAKIEQLKTQYPFSLNDQIKPKGGIILAGHANLIRAGFFCLGGKDERIRNDFDASSAEIADSFLSGKVPFPPCYAGYTWAEDAIFALESLRLHDVLFHTDYSKARQSWLSWLKKHLDPDSGMMVSQVNLETGEIIDGPRGCAISWALAFLPNIDPEFARSQYTLFRKNWFVPFDGMLGINEWYKGHELPTQFPTGPVVGGMGEAATGIGIGTCRANGDYVSWHLILRALNVLGFPLWTPSGEKAYFYGQCILADALALWGETVRPWDRSAYLLSCGDLSANERYDHLYLIVCTVATVISASIVGLLGYRAVKLCSDRSAVRPGWKRVTALCFAFQAVPVILFFCTTKFSWPQILVYMLMVDLFEEMTIRPRIVAEQFAKK